MYPAAVPAARSVTKIQGDPAVMLNCHCRDCQRAGGSVYAPVLVAPKSAVSVRGEPRYHRTVGRAGNAVERGFCVACGSQVMLKLGRLPDVVGVQAGSLDDPSIYRPAMDIFTENAHAWDHMSPTTQKLPGGVPG